MKRLAAFLAVAGLASCGGDLDTHVSLVTMTLAVPAPPAQQLRVPTDASGAPLIDPTSFKGANGTVTIDADRRRATIALAGLPPMTQEATLAGYAYYRLWLVTRDPNNVACARPLEPPIAVDLRGDAGGRFSYRLNDFQGVLPLGDVREAIVTLAVDDSPTQITGKQAAACPRDRRPRHPQPPDVSWVLYGEAFDVPANQAGSTHQH